jgi:act minimal PKS acyl carrier protein
MTRLTLDGLRQILLEGAGEDEEVDLGGDIIDIDFADLGYDSIALLETASRIQRQFDARLDDEAVAAARTPRALIDLTNNALVHAS